MCSLDFGEIACNKYPVLLLLLLLQHSHDKIFCSVIYIFCLEQPNVCSGKIN